MSSLPLAPKMGKLAKDEEDAKNNVLAKAKAWVDGESEDEQ